MAADSQRNEASDLEANGAGQVFVHDVPLPVEETKHIIRKCTKDDFEMADPEDDEQQVYCPVANRTISEMDCIEICDVANEMMTTDVLNTFDPPIEWDEEQKKRCRCCEYHIY